MAETTDGGIEIPFFAKIDQISVKNEAEKARKTIEKYFNQRFNKNGLLRPLKDASKDLKELFASFSGGFKNKKGDVFNYSLFENELKETTKRYKEWLKYQERREKKAQENKKENEKKEKIKRNKEERTLELKDIHSQNMPESINLPDKYDLEIDKLNTKLSILEKNFVNIDDKRTKVYKNTKAEIISTIGEINKLKDAQKEELQQEKNRAEEQKLLDRQQKTNRRFQAEEMFLRAMGGDLTEEEKLRIDLQLEQTKLDNLKDSLQYFADADQLQSEEAQNLLKQVGDVNYAVVQLKKELNKMTKISAFQKLANTIKRVGLYRIARKLFSVIEQGLSGGISSLRNFDSSFNDTMLKMESYFQIMNESFVLIFSSVLEAIEPVISSIATTVAQIANTISKTVASLKGATTYTAINADYMKSMSDSANSTLLSFDKFESLDAQESSYTTESLTDGDNALIDSELLTTISDIWQNILDLINDIIDVIKSLAPIITPIVDLILTVVDVVSEIANAIIDYIEPAIEWVSNVVGPLIQSISDGIKAVVALFKGDFSGAIEYIKDLWINVFKDIGNFFIGIINTLIGDFENFINGIISGINWIIKGINTIGGWFGNDSLISEISKISLGRISYFADGGLVDSGSLFVAGESGAELVTTMPSGQTGVTNIAQFKQAMVEALYECSDLFQSGENSVVLNLDGAEVARSKRFTSEMNRKNAGLNLR